MAIKVATASGTFSTMTWNNISKTSLNLHALTNVTMGFGTKLSPTFTAPGIGNTCKGVFVYCYSIAAGATGTITCRLLENNIAVATANTKVVANYSATNYIVNSTLLYFEFPTPFAFTSVTAGYYKFDFVNALASGTVYWGADATTATLVAIMPVDNRSAGTPGSGDDIVIGGDTAVTEVIMDGTQTVGNRTNPLTGEDISPRSFGAVNIGYNGKLTWDTAASAALTCRGHFEVLGGGNWGIGNSGAAYPTGKTATLTMSMAASGGHSFYFGVNSTVNLYGIPVTSYKSTWASGTGTAASPLVTATTTGWAVGDEIAISGSVYNTYETRFIRTVVSGTTYTLADTEGGAESALANTHYTTDIILMGTRNIKITSDNAAYGIGMRSFNSLACNYNYVNFEYFGSVNQYAYFTIYSTAVIQMKYCSFTRAVYLIFIGNTTKAQGNNASDIVAFAKSSTTAASWLSWTLCANFTVERVYYIGGYRSAFVTSGAANCTFSDIQIFNCGRQAAALYPAITVLACPVCTYTRFSVQACRGEAFYFNGLSMGNKFYDSAFGDVYANSAFFTSSVDNYIDISFTNCTFQSTLFSTPIVDTLLSGSKIKMHRKDATANKHFMYSPEGTIQSTGAGLDDSTVRTAGSLGVRMSSTNLAAGLQWEFKILAKSSTNVYCAGFSKKSAGLVGKVVNVKLFLPGSIAPDATTVLTDNENWNSWIIAANYTGNVDLYATVRITVFSGVATDYLYVDDLYNGTNKITALDVWEEGMPSPIMFEQLGDAAAVWAVATSGLVTVGTIGKMVTDINTNNPSTLLADERAKLLGLPDTTLETDERAQLLALVNGLTRAQFVDLLLNRDNTVVGGKITEYQAGTGANAETVEVTYDPDGVPTAEEIQ